MFSLSRASNNSIRNKVIVETEIAGLRGAVGQYNVIQTLPYKSVAPMHESAYVVECPPQLGKLTSIRITIWQGSLEVNTSKLLRVRVRVRVSTFPCRPFPLKRS